MRTNQLLRDLKAATLLGNPEAVNIALDGLLGFPGVAANDQMDAVFIMRVILPVGSALKPLPTPQLRPLLKHPLAAGRATGSVALALQFAAGEPYHATPKDLRVPGADLRPDVRISLGEALNSTAHTDPEKVLNLGTNWLMGKAPKLRHTALIFLPALADVYGKRLVGLLGPVVLDEDYDVRKALVNALTDLGESGLADHTLELLSLWAGEPHPNAWVICRTISSSWAAAYPAEVEEILRAVHAKTGDTSEISNAVKALDRRGVTINL